MITGRQIRAARALTDMSQDELAAAAGLTPQAIRKIENGDVTPREGTIADIVRTFYERRVEFIEDQGVRFIPEDVQVLTGRTGFARFTDLIFASLQNGGGTIRHIGLHESFFDNCDPEQAEAHRKRMVPLVSSRKDIFVRAILPYGDTNFKGTDYAEYKWHPQGAPPPIPYYMFDDKVCIFSSGAEDQVKIIVISSPSIALTFSEHFDQAWSLASKPKNEI